MRGKPQVARAKPLCEGLKLLGFGRNGLAGCHIIDEGMSAAGRRAIHTIASNIVSLA